MRISTAFLIPTKGLKTFDDFLRTLLLRIEETWARHGAHFDKENLSVLVFKRSNRSLIGSMNDAIHNIRFKASDCEVEGTQLDWTRMEQYINERPCGSLDYLYPVEVLAKHLASSAPGDQNGP